MCRPRMDEFGEDRGGRHDHNEAASQVPDAEELQASLRELAVVRIGTVPLAELLMRVATLAVQAVPGAEGAGVMLVADQVSDRVETVAASAPFVADIEAIQYDLLGEGPGVAAAAQRCTLWSGSLGGETRWPRFGPRVGRLCVHSVLCVPLLLHAELVGALTLYAHDKDVFDARAASLGELFATPAAVAVHTAHVLAQAQRLNTQLETAMTSRAVIEQAIGILRSRSGGTVEETLARLRAISQTENKKLTVIAQHIVDEAVRRARARHTDS